MRIAYLYMYTQFLSMERCRWGLDFIDYEFCFFLYSSLYSLSVPTCTLAATLRMNFKQFGDLIEIFVFCMLIDYRASQANSIEQIPQ